MNKICFGSGVMLMFFDDGNPEVYLGENMAGASLPRPRLCRYSAVGRLKTVHNRLKRLKLVKRRKTHNRNRINSAISYG